jgi:predicted DNA-binding ribbon-helix-helix protein
MRDIRTTRAEKMSSKTKRAIMLHGRKTSVSLEEPFWRAFRLIADERRATAGATSADVAGREKSAGTDTPLEAGPTLNGTFPDRLALSAWPGVN